MESVSRIIEAIEKDVELKVKEIITNAEKEKEEIIKKEKVKIDSEFEEKSSKLKDEYKSKLNLAKISYESEMIKKINQIFTEIFNSIYPEIEKAIEEQILSNGEYKNLIFYLLRNSIDSIKVIPGEKVKIILSERDLGLKDQIEKIVVEMLGKISVSVEKGDIKGGLLINLASKNMYIDNSLESLIKHFRKKVINGIYRELLRV